MLASLLGEEKANKMRYGFQQLLCYWARTDACRVQLWPRERGQGWQTAKHHEQMHVVQLWSWERGQGWQTAKHYGQMHVPDDIEAYGTHRNYHTGPSEHNPRFPFTPCKILVPSIPRYRELTKP